MAVSYSPSPTASWLRSSPTSRCARRRRALPRRRSAAGGHRSPSAYRLLFRRIGALWLWFSRCSWTTPRSPRSSSHPKVDCSRSSTLGVEVGMLELDYRDARRVRDRLLGLVPDLPARARAAGCSPKPCACAWREGVTRVHVHTCTLDHPAALAAYRRAGFCPTSARSSASPIRACRILPPDCAPQVPLLGTLAPPRPPTAERRSAPASPMANTANTACATPMKRRKDQRRDAERLDLAQSPRRSPRRRTARTAAAPPPRPATAASTPNSGQ